MLKFVVGLDKCVIYIFSFFKIIIPFIKILKYSVYIYILNKY